MMAKSSIESKWAFETNVSITAFKSQLSNIPNKAPKLIQTIFIAEETSSSITFKLGTVLITNFTAKLDFSTASPELTILSSPELDSVNTNNMKVFVGVIKEKFQSLDPQCVMKDG